jgi:hypothetical protein
VPVVSLAVLADEGENWEPTHFGYQLFGCEVGIRFPTSLFSPTSTKPKPSWPTAILLPGLPRRTCSPAKQKVTPSWHRSGRKEIGTGWPFCE